MLFTDMRSVRVLALAACMLLVACAGAPGKISRAKPVDPINNEGGMALRGYDPVAYFTDGAPVMGNPALAYQWQGITYHFATAEHREAFIAQPERYAPKFGGYCAFAVSQGTVADGDPKQWAIVM